MIRGTEQSLGISCHSGRNTHVQTTLFFGQARVAKGRVKVSSFQRASLCAADRRRMEICCFMEKDFWSLFKVTALMIESVRSTHIKELRGRRDLLVSQTAATVLKNEVTAIKLASAAESGKGSER